MSQHKELKAWQEATLLADAAVDLARDHWRPYLRALFDQLTRAALSVQLNIAEGHAFGSNRKFLHHLRIAKGSAAEAEDILAMLVRRGEVPQEVGTLALQRSRRCQALTFGLIKRLETML